LTAPSALAALSARRHMELSHGAAWSSMLGRRPPSFKYSVRTLAVLLLPSVILLDFGGGTLQGLAALGVMLVYLLHAARLDQSCFTVLWATVLLEAIGHAGSAFYTFGFGARGLGLIVLVALQAVLVGAWFSLQFPWLPLDQPELALLFERLLFNVAPLPAASIVTWAASVAWGAEDTPAVLLAALGAVSGHAPVASGARHHARDACISLSDTHFWVVSFCDPF
jgi:hypothetical protein